MALKPTIYKARIALSDLERNLYDNLNLTVALHPSETLQRMVARVLAFCLNYQDDLTFTKGLSDVEEPDLWVYTIDDKVQLWIDVGEPDPERVRKSARKASQVVVYSFNQKSDTWWQQSRAKISKNGVKVVRFNPESVISLSELVERTMDWSITITGESAFVATPNGEVEIDWQTLV
ncbi:MAG: YaeQ family protein [Gammaproteobacteria bacterium]|nr:YaeQ family protein [Gammaproteobacteria bacterium]